MRLLTQVQLLTRLLIAQLQYLFAGSKKYWQFGGGVFSRLVLRLQFLSPELFGFRMSKFLSHWLSSRLSYKSTIVQKLEGLVFSPSSKVVSF